MPPAPPSSAGGRDPVRPLNAAHRAHLRDAITQTRPLLLRQVSSLSRRYRLENADPDDLVQRAMTRAFAALESFRGRDTGALRAWIWTIARNAVRDELRRRSHAGARVARSSHGPDSEPCTEALNREHRARFTQALGGLAFEQRAAVVLRDVFELPWATVAFALGTRTSSAARAAYVRARRRLQER